jgi:hypothetical protein
MFNTNMKRYNMRSFGKQEFGKTFSPSLYRDSPHMNVLIKLPENNSASKENENSPSKSYDTGNILN